MTAMPKPDPARATLAPVLELEQIAKSFGSTQALQGVDFDLRPGEIHALVGENGAGKSTLIRILAGDHAPDRGAMRLAGQALRLRHPGDAAAAGIGFVHQRPAFAPELSITENYLVGLPFGHRRDVFAPLAQGRGWRGLVRRHVSAQLPREPDSLVRDSCGFLIWR